MHRFFTDENNILENEKMILNDSEDVKHILKVLRLNEGDQIEVDLTTGQISNLTNGNSYQAQSMPDFVLKIAVAGGIVNFLKAHQIEELL